MTTITTITADKLEPGMTLIELEEWGSVSSFATREVEVPYVIVSIGEPDAELIRRKPSARGKVLIGMVDAKQLRAFEKGKSDRPPREHGRLFTPDRPCIVKVSK